MRKLSFWCGVAVAAAALTLAAPAGATKLTDPVDAAGPLDVTKTALSQRGRSLVWRVHTKHHWAPGALDRYPGPHDADARSACLEIHRSGTPGKKQLCFGKPGVGKRSRLGYAEVASDGSLSDRHTIRASVIRLNSSTYGARFRPKEAGLRPHHYRWRVVTRWSGPACAAGPGLPCRDAVPDTRDARFRLVPVQPVGCRDTGPTPVFNGPRDRKTVALTFDDGPSIYTGDILSVLRSHHAKGTFNEIGDQIPGREAISRSVLRAGEELGNHSLHHETDPSRASMAETNRRIEAATGFTPCLFRPPGGAFDSAVIANAGSLGMTTVIWDVDPRDWSRPGTSAIYSRVVSNTRPGSIILLHDGGGDRSETVAALPHIIDTLRARGYRFVTVSKLLGQRFIWRPVR